MVKESYQMQQYNNNLLSLPDEVFFLIATFIERQTLILRYLSKKISQLLKYFKFKKMISSKILEDQYFIKQFKENSNLIQHLSLRFGNISECDKFNAFKQANLSKLVSLKLKENGIAKLIDYFLKLIGTQNPNALNTLIYLDLDLSDPCFTGIYLHSLQNISKLQNLENLNLTMRTKTVDMNFMLAIMQAVHGENLKRLHFYFSHGKFTSGVLEYYFKTLCQLKKLKQLLIDFIFIEIPKGEINHFSLLKECQELTLLHIVVHEYTLMSKNAQNNNLIKPLASIADMDPENAKKMRTLILNIDANEKDVSMVKELVKLTNFSNLLKLTIGLQNIPLNSSSIKELMFVKNLKFLENLSWYFRSCNLGNVEIKALSELNQEAKIQILSSLCLDLGCNKIGNEEIKSLGKLLEMHSLNSVELYLDHNNIKKIQPLLHGFIKHKTVHKKHLMLDLNYNPLEDQNECQQLLETCKNNNLNFNINLRM